MKKHIYKILFFASIMTTLVSCEVKEFSDLNSPEVDAFRENLTRGDLQDLVGGILYSSRVTLGTYFDDNGIIGREYYRFSSSDPRFTTDLLGGDNSVLDNNTFYITNPWAARYRTVKNANLILEFLDGQDTSAQFTNQEVTATEGFLKTFIAYELLLNLNLTDENGIRVDVTDENNLGPFVSKSAALSAIRAMLVDAASDLSNGGGSFPFLLSSGFAGFDDPSSFLQFNKAISARVAAYQGDDAAVLNFLGDSFLNLSSGDLDTGVYYTFSEDQTSLINPLFISVGGSSAAQARIVEPSFFTDAETGDTRVAAKTAQLSGPVTLDGLEGDHIVFVYQSNDQPIAIIRNEELILLYAEANISINPAESVAALDLIRASAGLGPYTGGLDAASLTDEMLHQRRYSLFAEGHRWIDMRRYGRLGDLPLARPDDDVWDKFPIPLTENQ
ncbi:RagB/SusD family nutrient uptake outer membrane protein [Constantimarinum furrinae]|uniref:Outer membrane protein n=1 Tax=Constantimarinum furrinae TaxID=2562285 RepID=A0A7G8PTR1_9FLAO|nr:RagB/SusD family nutrient uptake outer membrane protein [Constantimarinum furrinae]QNJ97727.1 Outer membrane protein [Constantimarinum furrinae]